MCHMLGKNTISPTHSQNFEMKGNIKVANIGSTVFMGNGNKNFKSYL